MTSLSSCSRKIRHDVSQNPLGKITRRGLLASTLTAIGLQKTPATPFADAHRRLLKAQTLLAELDERKASDVSDHEEYSLEIDRIVDESDNAQRDLLRLFLDAPGIARELTRLEWETSHVPVAVHREGNRVFMLVPAQAGNHGAYVSLHPGQDEFVRPVVLSL